MWLFKFFKSHRTERAPVKVTGVNTASLFIFHPLVNPHPWTSCPFFLLAVQLHLLQQEPSYRIHSPRSLLARKIFLNCILSHLIIYLPLYPPAYPFMNADDIDFPCNWAALQPRLQITGSTRRLHIPREPKSVQLETLLRCLATQPCFQPLFLTKRGNRANDGCSLVSLRGKKKHIYFLSVFWMCVEHRLKLATDVKAFKASVDKHQ